MKKQWVDMCAGSNSITCEQFPSFMDTSQVTKIIHMVEDKYGPPSSRTGMAGLGPVTATWREPGGMEIEVVRPSSTVHRQKSSIS